MSTPWNVAHRGGAKLAPENSLEAFTKALELEVDAIELDVHLSRDGHLMVIHDETLARTHQHSGKVVEMTLPELLAAGVPSLAQVLKLVGDRARLIVESKPLGTEEALVRELSPYLEQHLVISFEKETLKKLHKLQPALVTGVLFGKECPWEELDELGVTYLGPHHSLVQHDFMRRARRRGLKVNAWTVNSREEMLRLKEEGCDAITTDRPDLLKELLA